MRFLMRFIAAIFRAIPNRPCKPAAISRPCDCDLSPRNCRSFEVARILMRFISDLTKNLLWPSTPKGRIVEKKNGGRKQHG